MNETIQHIIDSESDRILVKGTVASGAVFSICNLYRYALWRHWDTNLPTVTFVGLNPSSADDSKDDPTIRKACKLAKKWNYGGILMLNLYAYISPYPKVLEEVKDPDLDNGLWLKSFAGKHGFTVFAWGAHPMASQRMNRVSSLFVGYALGLNKNGSPKHPLYVNSDSHPFRYDSTMIVSA